MAIDLEQVLELKRELEDDYRTRHDACRNLRRYWHGDYWRLADAQSGPVQTIFRDWGQGAARDVGPDVKLVHNVVQQVCVKFQTFLSPLPQISVYPDPPETDTRRAQATRKERYLYGCWSMAEMDKKNTDVAWYLPLMGDCFHGIWPNFDDKVPRCVVRSPEYAYPVPGFEGEEEAFIFSWKVRESTVRRHYPNYVPQSSQQRARGIFRKRGQEGDPMVELLEWSDSQQFARWINGQLVNGVEHGFGWNLFEHMKFINVPDEVWGHGAVEQAINLNEMGNALYSLMFQSVIENVFPRLVLIDPAKAPEEIDVGPGAVIPINPGGAVEWLHPPVQAIGMQEQFSRLNDQNILEASGMNRVNLGESPASSIVTGKAVNELQGASTGSTIEMVQGVGIGNGLVAWNEKAIRIAQQMFGEDKINLFGLRPSSSYDVNPRAFALSMKGKELIGGTRNEVTFSPALSMHEKVVMGLQMAGAGLVSKQWQRNQAGISDSDAMDEEVFAEAVDSAVLGFLLHQFEAAPDPGQAEAVEQQAVALLAGGTQPQPHPLLSSSAAAPPGAVPAGPPQGPPAGGPSPAQPPPAPPGSPAAPAAPPQGAPPEAAQQGAGVTLDQAVAAFQAVQGTSGRVFLVGEIVARGQTSQDVEVALTEQTDEQVLERALPKLELTFHVIAGEPQEPFVEVTPGKKPRPGAGAEQAQQQAPAAPAPA